MGGSNETFAKKQREKQRAMKKKQKLAKKEARLTEEKKGVEIDWSSAPENVTLTQSEIAQRAGNKE